MQHDGKLPSFILKTKHYFHSIADRITKFDVFYVVFDLRQFWLYIANSEIQPGDRPSSWIFKLRITFILLEVESSNLNCFLQNLICNSLGNILHILKSNLAPPSWIQKYTLLESPNLFIFFSIWFATIQPIWCKLKFDMVEYRNL